ncbi:protease complex subunit PrcB family protein [Marinimicrobium sp. C2-29]|uniref:protease complex subunit PrcB family protein n=1 Tax=Marinimicrobium sp. C2-29 TaxID=3139825 RepID=UPI00313A2373
MKTLHLALMVLFAACAGCDDEGSIRVLNDANSSEEQVPFEIVSCPATSAYTHLGEEEVHEPFEVVIEDPHQFRELYLTIDPTNQEEIPAIDFSENRSVFIYLGQQTNTFPEVRLDEVISNESGITVTYENVQPSADCETDGALTEPYCIISLPKSDEPIRFSVSTVKECYKP